MDARGRFGALLREHPIPEFCGDTAPGLKPENFQTANKVSERGANAQIADMERQRIKERRASFRLALLTPRSANKPVF